MQRPDNCICADLFWEENHFHRPQCPANPKNEVLEWNFNPFKIGRCHARLSPNDTGHFGRCELKQHDSSIDHCLERGLIWIRWPDAPIRFEEPH